MRSDQLTTDQLAAIDARVRPMLEYLAQLEQRMHQRKFPADDPLFALVTEARNCAQGLTVELSYLSPDGQVSKPVRQPKNIMPGNADDPLGRKPRKKL
jgi:hypothetical protein